MDFYEVIRTRRSVRKFKTDAVPDEVLNRVLDAARIAQSGHNWQPWRYIVIRDRERMKEMIPICGGWSFIVEAPVLVVACGTNLNVNRGGYMGDLSMLIDVSISFDHLTLAARAEGLGTCWIGSFNNDGVKEYLNIPDDVQVVAMTPMGYPAEEDAFSERTNRKGLDEIVSYERYE